MNKLENRNWYYSTIGRKCVSVTFESYRLLNDAINAVGLRARKARLSVKYDTQTHSQPNRTETDLNNKKTVSDNISVNNPAADICGGSSVSYLLKRTKTKERNHRVWVEVKSITTAKAKQSKAKRNETNWNEMSSNTCLFILSDLLIVALLALYRLSFFRNLQMHAL